MLQCVAVCLLVCYLSKGARAVIMHVAVCCSVLQCVFYCALQCVAVSMRVAVHACHR